MKELYEIIFELTSKIEKLEKRIKKLEKYHDDQPTLFEAPKERFKPPTIEEVRAYFKQNGYSILAANKAFQYYNEAKWKDGRGNQIHNWKQKMVAVWFREENKYKVTTNHAPKVREDYGIISPNATPMPEHLKNRIKNIGK